MKKPNIKEVNRDNLLYIAQLISEIDYYPFYGTLLGLIREGDIIDDDDDVDIFVPYKERNRFFELVSKSELNIDFNNNLNHCTPYFIQFNRSFKGVLGLIDVHFIVEDGNYLVDWQTEYAWENGKNPFKILSSIVYPLKSKIFFDVEIKMPCYPIGCCRVVFGRSWKVPKKKFIDYVQDVNGGMINIDIPVYVKICRKIMHYIKGLIR